MPDSFQREERRRRYPIYRTQRSSFRHQKALLSRKQPRHWRKFGLRSPQPFNSVRITSLKKISHLSEKVNVNTHIPIKWESIGLLFQIEVRRCVWWNAQILEVGGWDTEGCYVIETTPDYTRCSCSKFGTFTILAEKVEEKVTSTESVV